MSILEERQRCSFTPDGGSKIEFPIESSELEGALRDHVHEYSHSPGGQPEKLGRRLYTAKLAGEFSGRWESFPNLQQGLEDLMHAFEAGKTGLLQLPTRPKPFRAYCTNWTVRMEARVLSGEKVTLAFREDSENDSLIESVAKSASWLKPTQDAFKAELERVYAGPNESFTPGEDGFRPQKPSIFDAVDAAVNDVLSVGDTAGAFQQLAVAKVERLEWLINEADRSVRELQDPAHYPLIDAFHDVWLTCVSMGNDILGKSIPIETYMVTQLMAISQVSSAVYGVASRTNELLSLNPRLDDPSEIRAGTLIRYYVDG